MSHVVKATIPVHNHVDELRSILAGDSTDTNDPRTQFRLADLRTIWNRYPYTDRELDSALIRLVENGEIALFPLHDVTKIRIEDLDRR